MIFRKKQPIPEEAVSLREQRAMLGDRLSFAASEAYKLLRTNLTFALPDEKKCRVVGVTSAMRGEGKSTNNRKVAARMIRLVATHMMAEPRMTTAKMTNINKFAVIIVLSPPYLVLVLNLPISSGAPPSMRLGRLPPL